jgi:hypothetical protein
MVEKMHQRNVMNKKTGRKYAPFPLSYLQQDPEIETAMLSRKTSINVLKRVNIFCRIRK